MSFLKRTEEERKQYYARMNEKEKEYRRKIALMKQKERLAKLRQESIRRQISPAIRTLDSLAANVQGRKKRSLQPSGKKRDLLRKRNILKKANKLL